MVSQKCAQPLRRNRWHVCSQQEPLTTPSWIPCEEEDWDAHDPWTHRWDQVRLRMDWENKDGALTTRDPGSVFSIILALISFKSQKCHQRRKKGRGRRKRRRMVRCLLFFPNSCLLNLTITFFVLEKTELTIEDKYKKTMEEIECLKDELGKF